MDVEKVDKPADACMQWLDDPLLSQLTRKMGYRCREIIWRSIGFGYPRSIEKQWICLVLDYWGETSSSSTF
jgi:hypothetical protein